MIREFALMRDKEAHLCATSGPWYFYLIRESFQDVLLTADMGMLFVSFFVSIVLFRRRNER